MNSFFITTFYKFIKLDHLESIQIELETIAEKFDLKGLIILGTEGLNATISAPSENALSDFKSWACSRFDIPELMFKYSKSATAPFRRFKVKVRNEIVTLGTPELTPSELNNHHLTPEEWNKVLTEESDFLLIDTRNWYETKLGTFKGAINPRIDQFTEFPEWLEKQNYSKDKKVLIFCTGGIRCEKGILDLQRKGFNNVYQLQGGILKYLEEKPNDQFEGECFVFDHRVAVDQNLEPSNQYKLCPHCGQPAATEIECKRCDSPTLICENCIDIEWKKNTCSKNCAYHLERDPDSKGLKQIVKF